MVVRRDGAVEVRTERASAGEERLDEDRVELDPGHAAHCCLQQTVGRTDHDAEHEGAADTPPEALATPRDVRDGADQEEGKDAPLDHALRPLIDSLRRFEPQEAGEVDAKHQQHEAERDDRCLRQTSIFTHHAVEQE